jgi:hypothetical protein
MLWFSRVRDSWWFKISFRPFSRESTGRELSKSINACGGAEMRLDSVLKPKNIEDSTKRLQILEHQKKLSNFTMDKFFPLWFDNHFLALNLLS